MKIAYICEENPVILQDLAETVCAFDDVAEIVKFEDVASAADLGIEGLPTSVIFVNASQKTFRFRDFLSKFEEDGGKVICIGTLGPMQAPPASWIMVDAPFTTQSIDRALRAAGEINTNGARCA